MSDNRDTPGRTPLADKINNLFAAHTTAGRKPPSNADVARAITEQGTDISSSYIAELRAGNRTNPTLKHLEGLAKYFGVHPAYFFDDETTETIDKKLQHLRAMQDLQAALDDDGVRILALKARGLSPTGLQHIEQIVDYVRSLEQEHRQRET